MNCPCSTVEGLGDWADVTDFFTENIFGKFILDVGTGAAKSAVGSLVSGALGPSGQKLGAGQIIYQSYTLPGSQGVAPRVEPELTAPIDTAPDYRPWIAVGIGVAVLIVILR